MHMLWYVDVLDLALKYVQRQTLSLSKVATLLSKFTWDPDTTL